MESLKKYANNRNDTTKTSSDSKIEEEFLSSWRNRMILFACFIISLLTNGLARLSGLLFVSCITHYNIGRKQASFPFVLAYAVRNITGLLIGYLGRRFGSEVITLYGCLLSAIGIGACFFATNITLVSIFWGGIFGLGFGMGTALIPYILHQNFAQHFDKANGIYYGGAGVGALLLPIIAEALLESYGTPGTFLILCGIVLNCIPASILLMNIKRAKKPLKISIYTCTNQNKSKSDADEIQGIEVNTPRETRLEVQNFAIESLYELPSNVLKKGVEVLDSSSGFDLHAKTIQTLTVKTNNLSTIRNEINRIRELSEVFLDPTFHLIIISQSCLSFILVTLWTVIVDFSRDRGVTLQEEVYIFIGLAVPDMLGRFTLGIITDFGYISKLNFCVLCLGILGLTMICFTWSKGFIMIMILICVCALFTGGLVMIANGICSVYMEKDNVIIAMSSRLLLYPLLAISQPFVIEYFRDYLKSYSGLFYFLAGMCFTCAVLTLLIPVAARWREKRKQSVKTDQQ